MERYRNSNGDSGVAAYEIGADYILVKFTKGGTYSYSYRKAGQRYVDEMKRLAQRGRGLNSYINKTLRTCMIRMLQGKSQREGSNPF